MLQPFFQWMQESSLSAFFLNYTWASPVVQCIHLLALVVFAGAILIVDVRLLGRGLIRMPLGQLARSVQPYLIWSFVLLVLTGVPQMASTALKEYYSPQFWWKMKFLFAGLLFTFTIRRKVLSMDEDRLGGVWPKVVGLASVSIWTTVTVFSRLIGLLS